MFSLNLVFIKCRSMFSSVGALACCGPFQQICAAQLVWPASHASSFCSPRISRMQHFLQLSHESFLLIGPRAATFHSHTSRSCKHPAHSSSSSYLSLLWASNQKALHVSPILFLFFLFLFSPSAYVDPYWLVLVS